MATKLKTVGGIDIYVTDEGKFSAKIGRDTITRKDLASVEKADALLEVTDFLAPKSRVQRLEEARANQRRTADVDSSREDAV